ncbi:MAG: hypothetical protein M5T52_19070 [Ignavibacteriaceae bacterium]|nr:hypothetical protein [Ignavibacteriaceae bacterium]
MLLKTGEGKYSLSVFPFRKHQTRIVVIDYYSIVESSSIVLPEWYFKIVSAYNIKAESASLHYRKQMQMFIK